MTPNWMDLERLLRELRAAGFSVRTEGGKLLVAPAPKLSASQRAALAKDRDGLIDLLQWEADPPPLPTRGVLRAWFFLLENPPVNGLVTFTVPET